MARHEPAMLVESEAGPAIRQAIFDAIENQIRDRTPPEVAQALVRLMAAGEPRDNALRYTACALSVEFFEILHNEAGYNEARYVRNLQALPVLPYDESEI